MIVCIAEKPSVARDIAHVLGANSQRDGYMEGNGYQVTWTFGHLCELKEPHEYFPQWKSWSLAQLPMIPPRFGIRLKGDKGIAKQFETITRLMKAADTIVNCGDAGQEGELIQRWVMSMVGVTCPVKRLWISSLTEEAIRDGFQQLKDQSEYQSLYLAGYSRATGDWLLGMNATRLYTLKYGQGRGRGSVLSIGRVQTPTLALIVKRQQEIEDFQPTPYWVLSTVYRDTSFTAVMEDEEEENETSDPKKKNESASKSPSKRGFLDKDEAYKALDAIRDLPFTVTEVKKTKGREAPPRLFDLTSLQVECNRKYGFSADTTLQVIQSLYEKKFTTYPRVDTTFLPDDVYPKCGNILNGLRAYFPLMERIKGKPLVKSKKVFDNSKVTDHHAIIPTGTVATGMSEFEEKVYDLICRRFIGAFYPDCLFHTTTVTGVVGDIKFRTTGKVITDPGWKILWGYAAPTATPAEASGSTATGTSGALAGTSGALAGTSATIPATTSPSTAMSTSPSTATSSTSTALSSPLPPASKEESAEEENKHDNEEKELPEFKKGESGAHFPDLTERTTTPPRPYTEATLLRAMETAGRFVEDDELRDALKENGIGRPSTRAAIIETLFQRHYIRKERKNLWATPTGVELIGLIREDLLKSAELTGRWEKKLRQIEQCEYEATTFISELKQMVHDIVIQVLSDNSNRRVPDGEESHPKKQAK